MTVDVIPEDVWLEIFEFDRLSEPDDHPWEWARLAHVCQKWRQLIFASPLRLKLRILCKYGSQVRENLGIWPAVPLVVDYADYRRGGIELDDEDDVIAALEHPDRLYCVRLNANGLPLGSLGKIIAMMQKPCPILTCVSISANDRNVPVLPAGFLGGSAPCLQQFRLCGVPFPALPTLLLSTSNLIDLTLRDILPTGYTSPEAMVAYLAALSRLKTLHLTFQTVTSHSARILPPPMERAVLPSLCEILFSGVFEYLEDFVAQIDTPQLNSIDIYYLDQGIDFEVPQLSEFFNRSENLKKTLSNNCEIILDYDHVCFRIIGGATTTNKSGCSDSDEGIYINIHGEGLDQNILQLMNVLSWFYPIISDMVHFNLQSDVNMSDLEDLDNFGWLELLFQFSFVQTMVISGEVTSPISHALQNIAEAMITKVFPALKLLCLEDQPASSVHKFLTFRQDSGYPVTFVNTRKEFEMLESFT